MSDRPTAAVLLVGNELLTGRVADVNLRFLAEELWRLGVLMRSAAVCRDDVDAIAPVVARLAAAHTWLFTAGGIGPTHDDVTIDGVARAFGLEVVVDPVLAELIRRHFGERLLPAHLRMARVPERAALEGGAGGGWPTVRCGNTYVLPGAPGILQRRFARIRDQLRQGRLHRSSLFFRADEAVLAPLLAAAAAAHPEVEIGSYPEPERVLITFEGSDAALVQRARNGVLEAARGIPGT